MGNRKCPSIPPTHQWNISSTGRDSVTRSLSTPFPGTSLFFFLPSFNIVRLRWDTGTEVAFLFVICSIYYVLPFSDRSSVSHLTQAATKLRFPRGHRIFLCSSMLVNVPRSYPACAPNDLWFLMLKNQLKNEHFFFSGMIVTSSSPPGIINPTVAKHCCETYIKGTPLGS